MQGTSGMKRKGRPTDFEQRPFLVTFRQTLPQPAFINQILWPANNIQNRFGSETIYKCCDGSGTCFPVEEPA
jgi:hypothetical protein